MNEVREAISELYISPIYLVVPIVSVDLLLCIIPSVFRVQNFTCWTSFCHLVRTPLQLITNLILLPGFQAS